MPKAAIVYGPRLLCLFPFVVLSAIYSTWLAARFTLGRWPRPSIDDPKDVDGLIVPAYYDATVLLIYLGIPAFYGLLATFGLMFVIKRPEGWMRRLCELGCAVLIYVCVTWIMHRDPFQAVTWFFD